MLVLLCLISEMPLPEPLYLWVQQGWEYAFKPFGEESGVGVLGAIMLWLGSQVLGRRYVSASRNHAIRADTPKQEFRICPRRRLVPRRPRPAQPPPRPSLPSPPRTS